MDTNDLEYAEGYVPYTRSELVGIVKQSVDDRRFQHIIRVEQTAIKLAEKNGVNIEKASIAALLHDYAKQKPDSEFVRYINDLAMDPELLDYGNAIWHGLVGAEIIKAELNIFDEEILNAVRYHTVGAPVMSCLDQVIFMADYVEPGRDFEGVEEARKVTNQNLKQGVVYQLTHTLSYLVDNKKTVFPAMIASYNAWVQRIR